MFYLSDKPILVPELVKRLADRGAGACATFEGWVRDHNEGKTVLRLEYEAYDELALSEGNAILDEARERFGCSHVLSAHRVGTLEIGDLAVWVGVSAPHRDEAFAACRYIIDGIKHRVPIWKKEYYTDGDSGWVNCERCGASAHDHDSAAQPESERAYYDRQMRLPQVGADGQRKLKESRVLVVGAGGLGCPALMYLATAGVGHLGICEGDRLEVSNLHRQPLFEHSRVGESKAQLAKARLEEINPFIDIHIHETRLDPANIEGIFRQYDLVLACTDNFEAKFLMNDAAVITQTPLVQASIYQFEGQLSFYRPGADTPCLRCLWPDVPEPNCIGTCAEVGVLGVTPGVLGTWQAMEAIKFIVGLPTLAAGEMLVFDLLVCRTDKIRFAKSPDCPVCGGHPRIKSISAANYAALADVPFAAAGPSIEVDAAELTTDTLAEFLLVDIREPYETESEPMSQVSALHLPASRFDSARLPTDGNAKVLLCCAHGLRSRWLAQSLRNQGFSDVFSLKGGIRALCETNRAGARK
ncbi:MAG: ThiF family adenylyltransferase [Candidatus Hydrogenedentes bacterium]|nr:ThiF family adenylyltransferase [Candidatus Hydrogenedentota bacterium]